MKKIPFEHLYADGKLWDVNGAVAVAFRIPHSGQRKSFTYKNKAYYRDYVMVVVNRCVVWARV